MSAMYGESRPYEHKIKTIDELRALLGARPRKKRVVMSHGLFDIVHPGHIRHLLYAKAKGDVLVASVMPDSEQAVDRPFVPQALRAMNLAALAAVDYVVMAPTEDAAVTIREVQPDFFVKGADPGGDVSPVTSQQMQAVAAYGGEFVFSPGDVVYSATTLLAYHKPTLAIDKLHMLMNAEGLTFETLIETLRRLRGVPVHVVGDTIVDKYSYCSPLGVGSKSRTMSVKLERSELFVGGAGVVAKHLRSLGADVTFTTVLGDDHLRRFVEDDLREQGIAVNAVVDRARPTTLKERFWADGARLLQVETVDNSMIADGLRDTIARLVSDTPARVVIFSDFRHGVFHANTIPTLIKSIPSGCWRVADSKVSHRWGNILDFAGFDLVTPNEREARFCLADQDTGVRPLGDRLFQRSHVRYLILKLGERGLMLYRHAGGGPRDCVYIDSFAEHVRDTMGAGDALLAASSLTLAQTSDVLQAAILGNLGAAILCDTVGNAPVTIEHMEERLLRIRDSR